MAPLGVGEPTKSTSREVKLSQASSGLAFISKRGLLRRHSGWWGSVIIVPRADVGLANGLWKQQGCGWSDRLVTGAWPTGEAQETVQFAEEGFWADLNR